MKYYITCEKYGTDDPYSSHMAIDLPKKEGEKLKEMLHRFANGVDWEFSDPMFLSIKSEEDIVLEEAEERRRKEEEDLAFRRKCGDEPGKYPTELALKLKALGF